MTFLDKRHRITVRHLTNGGDDVKPEDFDPKNINVENMPLQMLFHQVSHMHKHYFVQLLQQMSLKPGQAGILFVLNRYGELSQRELADRIGVKPPSVTVALQKMEKNEYITRRPDERDQRITRIEITDKGKDCVKNMNQLVEQTENVLFRNMSTEEIMLLRRLILQMRDNILTVQGFDMSSMKNPPHMGCSHDAF